MTLFDDFDRTDPSPASHLEDHFTFLNRVATPYWERVRALLAAWMDRLPDEDRADLVARMRSGDRRQFLGAFWETYLFVSFERLGFGLTTHPQVPGSSRRPDFRIETNDGSAYVEATVASASNDEVARDRRRGQIYDTINQLSCPNFWLSLDLLEEGYEAPSIRRRFPAIQAWLDDLDVDHASELLAAGSFDDLPTYDIGDRGWSIRITALPRGAESRGESAGRPIAFYPGESGSFDGRGPILAALREKAGRYGELDAPYVIAVMQETILSDHDDVFHALFGSLRITVPLDNPQAAKTTLGNDGFWRGQSGAQNTGVAAVLVAQNLYGWNITTRAPDLWHNPWAHAPWDDVLPWRTHQIGTDGAVETSDPRIEPHQLFALPEQWPGPEGPFDV
ncbi:MAG TPA: hypothetical protein VJA46_13530 [Acidimicrobiia bacterium]|nr:hypothetical protein [Acidimicrobiia bacterium]